MDMNSPKKPTSTLWVLEEEAEAQRPMASDTRAAVESLMERLKAKARAHTEHQKSPTPEKGSKLVWKVEPICVRVTSQEGLSIQD
ncbi:MAG: hypothetical protein GY822_03870 [Deltaproteobacteria bacterium]|nr:hypothetical protein [Deltaproteobacteria bacterium]